MLIGSLLVVCICIRSVTCVLIGSLRAFDRHFNCLLTEVDETIRYVKAAKEEEAEAMGSDDKTIGRSVHVSSSSSGSSRDVDRGVIKGEIYKQQSQQQQQQQKSPVQQSQSHNSRVKVTRRFLPQILLRGDAVVWIAKL